MRLRTKAFGSLLFFGWSVGVACSAPELQRGPDAPDAGHVVEDRDASPYASDATNDAKPTVVQKDIPAIDAAVAKLMSDHALPGVAIAITKGEKLVYAKGYGQVSPTDATPITNDSLFRIASVSKPLTSVAVMRLIEQGKLTMDSKVFGASGVLSDFGSPNLNAMADITIGHLLHHTSGNWPNDGTDPMFKQLGLPMHDFIQWTLDNYADKGQRGQYAYSNFGYCLLGRVIEKVSGKSYEEFVSSEVLAPAGITAMKIGGSSLVERKPNEVIYTGTTGDPYGMNVPRMDAHGGWIASATDLARFLVKIDGFSVVPDLLKPATETVMTTASGSNANYACGWSVNSSKNWWHTGGMPGTATEIIRGHSGFNWAILTNSGGPDNQLSMDIDNLIWPFVDDASTPWQDDDQF